MRAKSFIHASMAGLVLAAGLASPAFAEGNFTANFSQVSPGFNSRIWTDKNSDGVGTSVSLRYCSVSSNINTFQIRLYLRRFGPIPNENRGTGSYNCPGSTYKDYNFGRQPSADYYYQVYKVGNSSSSTGSASGHVYY